MRSAPGSSVILFWFWRSKRLLMQRELTYLKINLDVSEHLYPEADSDFVSSITGTIDDLDETIGSFIFTKMRSSKPLPLGMGIQGARIKNMF